MKKIALLLPNLRGGGAERVNLDLAHGLASQGYCVEFVLMRAEGVFLEEAATAFTVINMNVTRVRQVPMALTRYLRENRPDALVASIWPLTSCAAIAKVFSRQPTRVLLVEHNTLSTQYLGRGWVHKLLLRASLALGCRLSDSTAAVSRGAAEDLAKLTFWPIKKVHILHNVVPSRPLPEAVAMAKAVTLWPNSSGPKIITVGNLKPQKNHVILVQAFALLPKELDACLMILGEGALRSELEGLVKALGISDRVVFAGFHTNTTSFYQTSDLFVLSSDYEGFGNVIVEALACGVPVVSTDCYSGPAEILENGKYGKLVPVGDAEALAKAMLESIQGDHDFEALKRRAEDFSLDKIAKQYLGIMFPADKQSNTQKDRPA